MMKTMVAIGDSLTCGFPYTPRHSWVYAVGAALEIETVNKGICGETTGEMLHRFDFDAVALKPDIVVIMGGSNDAFAAIAASEVEQNIRLMVEKAGQYHIHPIVGLPIPCSYRQEEKLLEEYRQRISRYCAGENVTVIDFYSTLLEVEGGVRADLLFDGVHPNVAGYLMMADVAISVLQTVIDPEERK
jgi:lysophospholipase L1-like esterase